MGEADRRQAGHEVTLVSDAVLRLLGGGAVKAPAVGFDHDAQLSEEEVDSVAVDLGLALGLRKARSFRDRDEEALQFRVGEGEGPVVQQGAHGRCSRPVRSAFENFGQ